MLDILQNVNFSLDHALLSLALGLVNNFNSILVACAAFRDSLDFGKGATVLNKVRGNGE